MTIGEFIDKSTRRLTSFERHWYKQMRDKPGEVAADLPVEKWEEEFEAWRDLNSREGEV